MAATIALTTMKGHEKDMQADLPDSPSHHTEAEVKVEKRLADAKEARDKHKEEVEKSGPIMKAYHKTVDVLNGTGLQTFLYFVFVLMRNISRLADQSCARSNATIHGGKPGGCIV